MKSVVIASNSSGGGKTTFTIGLMNLLKRKGYDIAGYKVGPDYIDGAFHEKITGKPSRNLDFFLQGEDGLKAVYSRNNEDIGVVEGVMGVYDGIGTTLEASTAHVSKILGLPIILVISPKASSLTFIAELKGIIDFSDCDFAGIVLNNISKSYYVFLKQLIEEILHMKVLGYLPKDDRIILGSRHLGLVQSQEVTDLQDKIDVVSNLIEENIDVNSILELMKETDKFKDDYHLKSLGLRIGIAKDVAFSFYYKENIELLEEAGEVIYFSPLKDEKVPDDLDFIYLGGGYPEIFSKELSQNISFISSLRNELEKGTPCYAECGGLMYLMKSIDNVNMVGFFDGETYMTKTLNNFGYNHIDISENQLIKRNLSINSHEFHKSKIECSNKTVYKLSKKTFNGGLKEWTCGYIKNNTLGAYGHVHFFSNLDFIKEIIISCKERKDAVR